MTAPERPSLGDEFVYALRGLILIAAVAAFTLAVVAGTWVLVTFVHVLWGMASSSSGLSGPLF